VGRRRYSPSDLPIESVGLNGESNSSSLHILYKMVQFTRIFALLAVVSVGLAASVKRNNSATVMADVQSIGSNVRTLRTEVNYFKANSSLTAAVTIQSGCHSLVTSLTIATADANNCATSSA